jgi:hypothetical protein
MNKQRMIRETFSKNDGVFRLIPVFVPRRFSRPGFRLRLHPDDYYALGVRRGAIKERWFSSVITCMNGPNTPPDEGLSYVSCSNDAADRFLLKDAVESLGPELLGAWIHQTYGGWPMYSKFFDYMEPLFFHLHLLFEDAARVGRLGKPEAYYYPPQYNNFPGSFPHTYFGFAPDVDRAEVRERLLQFTKTDNRITELSRAYRIQLGTGWYTPPGVIHAPGSCLTYEPQWNSDVNAVYENVTAGEVNPYEQLVENCPDDRKDDVDYIMSLMDWEKNVDPHYRKHYFRPPLIRREDDASVEKWVVYGNAYVGAIEVTVHPGKTAIFQADTAAGCILTQGYGAFGRYKAAAPTLLRFGQLSADEFFAGHGAASKGIEVQNHSDCEPLVFLAHFPASPALAPACGASDCL